MLARPILGRRILGRRILGRRILGRRILGRRILARRIGVALVCAAAGCGDRFVDESGEGGGGGGSLPTCGNSVLEAGEQCDDGNADADDGCSACAYDCKGARESPLADRCYRLLPTPLAWPDALATCKGLGGGFDLAAPSTQAEFTAVTTAVAGTYWLGGNDLETEGFFAWSSGEAWVYTHGLAPWLPTEPSNGAGENCVETGAAGMSDAACDRPAASLCERGMN